jgi:hypothetical protein
LPLALREKPGAKLIEALTGLSGHKAMKGFMDQVARFYP